MTQPGEQRKVIADAAQRLATQRAEARALSKKIAAERAGTKETTGEPVTQDGP